VESRQRGVRGRGSALLLLALLLLAGSCGGVAEPAVEKAAAERAADRWLRDHPTEWIVNVTGTRGLTRPASSRTCDQDPPNGFTALQYNDQQTDLLLFFRCPVGIVSTAEDVSRAFAFAVLDSLPHGLRASGWQFVVMTPSSSVYEEVTFVTPSPGRLQVRIETPLHGLYARSTRPACEPAADAPMAEECYLFREHRIPLRLTLTVPFTGAGLR
jgi:hypothetical protein